MTAYSVDVTSTDSKDFKSPLAFDAYDLWLGADFDHFMDGLLEDLFDEIESDLKSVWSTNLSEQESAQYSAQRSADADAMGLDTDDGAFGDYNGSGLSSASLSASTGGMSSATSASDASLSHDLSDHDGFKHKGHFHDPLESRYSGTESDNLGGDTQGSRSRGTSNKHGEASTVSTQSITLEEFKEFYANDAATANYSFKDAIPNQMAKGNRITAGVGGGVEWAGDADSEFVFGSSWHDTLMGDGGDDTLYGFEGDDIIYGGSGKDKLFGDAGDDILYAVGSGRGDDGSGTGVNLLSGGSGNDSLFGDVGAEAMFGGPGHDYLSGGVDGGTADSDYKTDELFGEAGDDILVTAPHGDHELSGGDGNDLLLAGTTMAYIGTLETPYPGIITDRLSDANIYDGVNDGDLDLDGGDGDDVIMGGTGADDIFGGDGDDIIVASGARADDGQVGGKEVDAGAGDDEVYVMAFDDSTDTVVKGGDGDDFISAGITDGSGSLMTVYRDGAATDHVFYAYGDAGDDVIYGMDFGDNYLFGGSGEDFIYSGTDTVIEIINAGEGDDEVYINDADTNQMALKVYLGKGDDLLGDNGDGGHNSIFVYGEEGDDEINAINMQGIATQSRYFGGNGDDTIYGPAESTTGATGSIILAGQGGSDRIVLDDDLSTILEDITVFGDWGYGTAVDRYDADEQYGDSRLEKKLLGDADYIFVGEGDGPAVTVFAGDGNDTILSYGGHTDLDLYGGRGNDIIFSEGNVPAMQTNTISGGLGDDLIGVAKFGEFEAENLNLDELPRIGYGRTIIYGGEGNDKIGQYTGAADEDGLIKIYGDEGNDKILGVVDAGPSVIQIYGGEGNDYVYGSNGVQDDDSVGQIEDVELGAGDDKYIGDDSGFLNIVIGGAGDDKILGGNNWGTTDAPTNGFYMDFATGLQVLTGGDLFVDGDTDLPAYGDPTAEHNTADDGDDLLDLGDNNYSNFAFGNAGNDKIIGGGLFDQGQKLYGGRGDDKIYAINPSQRGTATDTGTAPAGDIESFGGYGNDEIHGADWDETIFGDREYGTSNEPESYAEGGDDVIYGWGGDDTLRGGPGADFVDGGDGDDTLHGGSGNDKVFGKDGDDTIHGDGGNGNGYFFFGDDILYGGDGDDTIFGQYGDDIIHGGNGDDTLAGQEGEDTIYGGDGDDSISTGRGWDTVFGGDGCDSITAFDGGDVIWLGDCDGSEDQVLTIRGTGDDPENFTVVMDFWLESAKPWNRICLEVSSNQDEPSAPKCDENENLINNDGICVDAIELADPTELTHEQYDVGQTAADRELGDGEWRGSGCKHDGGPLWISIPIVDDPVVAEKREQRPSSQFWSNPTANTYFQNEGAIPMTIWARFFQRAPKKPVISRKKPRITSYNNPERYEYSNRYESTGRDYFGTQQQQTGYSYGGNNFGASSSSNTYYPRLSHRGFWSQTESISYQDEELVECLRIFICETEGADWQCYVQNTATTSLYSRAANWGACGNNMAQTTGTGTGVM